MNLWKCSSYCQFCRSWSLYSHTRMACSIHLCRLHWLPFGQATLRSNRGLHSSLVCSLFMIITSLECLKAEKQTHIYVHNVLLSIMPNQSINLSIKDACLHYWRSNYRSACLQKTDVTNMYIIHLKLSIHFILGLPLGLFPSIPLTYALTFAGLNFRGSQILAIFAFIFSWMRGISLWFVVSSESLLYIDVINCFGGGS